MRFVRRSGGCGATTRPVRDGMLVENASPTSQPPSRQGRNVKIIEFNVQSLRDFPLLPLHCRHRRQFLILKVPQTFFQPKNLIFLGIKKNVYLCTLFIM
ncbi:MAG: hypothetical protein LBD59_03220 [Prevotellaceae bacterium]|nr:hypothetical protein [Prevotellaceae bacterium]